MGFLNLPEYIMKKIKANLILVLIAAFPFFGYAQQLVKGKILSADDDSSHPVPGAVIWSVNAAEAITSGPDGEFSISIQNFPSRLIITASGFRPDTIEVSGPVENLQVKLKSTVELNQVNVTAKREHTEISTIKTLNSELLTEAELLKAACCNLSESFETNPSVDASYTDAVTGAKEIRLLGLTSTYTQVMAEAIPTLRGIAVPYGFNFVPGPWMESIQISKGAGSVANGYEAITGQINIEFKKPMDSPPLYLNVFADNEGRTELNTLYSVKMKKNSGYMLLLHGNITPRKTDHNHDNFLDQPIGKQVNLYNRFNFQNGKNLEGQFGIKTMLDDRQGGQMQFDPDLHKGSTTFYGTEIKTRRIEIYSKTGKVYIGKPYKSMGLQLTGAIHDHKSYFGLKKYDAMQKSFYANYAYITKIGSEDHKLKAGVDFKMDRYDENYNDSLFKSTEYVPGIYAEYSYSSIKRIGYIIGLRADQHNTYGTLVSPRVHIKYNFTPDLVMRISGGKGYRTPKPFSDNISVMANNKIIRMLETPELEEAWNGGVNLTFRTKFFRREGSITVDAYRTEFVNQLIADQYTSAGEIWFYNLEGNSFANSLQFTFNYEPVKNLDIKLAWKIDDVHTDYKEEKGRRRPLLSRDKALANLGWHTDNDRWRVDFTAQWEGPKPLPPVAASGGHIHEPDSKQEDEYSPDFYTLQGQVTRVFKVWELYAGVENLLDYTQMHPIINAENPFSESFDASSVWGPVMGRKFYAGIRLTLK